MHIDISYLAVALVCLILGFLLGRRYGHQAGQHLLMKASLAVKNPEMWELLHFLVVDEREKKRGEAKNKPTPRRAPPAA